MCVSDEKEEWVECKQEWAPEHATYIVTTWAWTWNGQTYVGNEVCAWSCDADYHEETDETWAKMCVSDNKEEWVECKQEWAPEHATYTITTWAWTWNGQTYVGNEVCAWSCDADYHLEWSQNNTIAPILNPIENIVNPQFLLRDVEAWTTAGPVCVPNSKTVECMEGKAENATYTVTWVEITWNDEQNEWNEVPVCQFTCNKWYHLNANKNGCDKDSTWGGWGWGSAHYSCKWEVPANAVANNNKEPSNSSTNYSYSTDKEGVCTFQCEAGYTRKDGKCEKSGWNNWWDDDEEIELGWQVSDKCSVEWTNRSEEEIAAYLYACENDITTIRDINKARLGDFLTRAEMAKMISVFATKELWMKPNTSKDCSNFANSIASYNQEMKDYMVMACQLEIMGIHTTNYEAIPDFMPSKRVSRAEFGTVLSRVLWWNKYEWTNSNYYVNHLNALKENNIITNINPHITEYRAWVFLMLYRSVEAIKVLKAASNESIEQQVNEELQEEWKAETGLVVEYDSGSVVPDMATVTESGTLSTWTVAEIITGSVVETETWATTTLTGEDISKEVSAETGTVVETWSTSD